MRWLALAAVAPFDRSHSRGLSTGAAFCRFWAIRNRFGETKIIRSSRKDRKLGFGNCASRMKVSGNKGCKTGWSAAPAEDVPALRRLAATALEHNLTLITQNDKHFPMPELARYRL